MLVRTAIAVSLLAALSLTAQVTPEVELPMPPPPAEVLESAPPGPVEELAQKEARVRSDADAIGTNGELLLDGASDVALRVFNGPIRFTTNATSTPGSGVDRMRIWPTTGNVVIGTTSSQAQKLFVLNTAVGGAFFAQHDRTYTSNASASEASNYGVHYLRVSEGVTQSGHSHALRGVSYLFDKGTLSHAYGLSVEVANFPAAAPNPNTGTISNAYGLYSSVKKYDGTITNGYGAYVAAVDSSVSGYGLVIANVTAPNDWGIYQAGADDDNYFGGRIGIGKLPTDRLNIFENADVNTVAKAENPYVGAGAAAVFNASSNTAGVSVIAHSSARTLSRFGRALGGYTEVLSYNGNGLIVGSSTNTPLVLGTNNLSRVFVAADGDVGIGVDSDPQAKLHVAGNVLVTGSITGATVIGAVYQDVAEWVPASIDMEPGTVVVLNHGRTNEVMPSHSAYDTSVAGVVSAQPGVLLGIGGDSKEQIATTGRVKVRVDATRAPIRVGDLLVTSDVSGTAMRSEPMDINGRRFHQPGTIIGKALEPLERGTGEILVLLSMQ